MKKLLVISRFVPYSSVPHAGGQSHNYYIKRLNKESNFDVKLISYMNPEEAKKIDLLECNIDYHIINYSKHKKIIDIPTKFNIFDKNAGYCSNYVQYSLKKYLKKLKRNGYFPDIVVLEWTQIVLLAHIVKNIYPTSKIVAIEHDVSYLALERKSNYGSLFEKTINKIRYKKLYKQEIKSLKLCDGVITLNIKDKNLLKNDCPEIKNLIYISPYYQDITLSSLNFQSKNIVFYGAMNRKENYESVNWFIDNVFNELIKLDSSYKFYVVGNKPHKSLIKKQSENIIITGFVKDVKDYFEKSLCMVAPLVLGAGIKIKVLEAMKAGCIVITNNIGIEGIPAIPNKHYFHCEQKEEYIETILNLSNNSKQLEIMSSECEKFINENFLPECGYAKMNDLLNMLCK